MLVIIQQQKVTQRHLVTMSKYSSLNLGSFFLSLETDWPQFVYKKESRCEIECGKDREVEVYTRSILIDKHVSLHFWSDSPDNSIILSVFEMRHNLNSRKDFP